MANTKQQRKRVKIATRQHAENLRYKSRIKTMFKSLTVATQDDQEKASRLGQELISLIDKAASRGVIHPNNAGHKKSRVSGIVELAPGVKKPEGPATKEPVNGKSKKDQRAERHQAQADKKAAVKEKRKAKAEAETKAAKAEAEAAKAAPAEEAAPEAAEAEETAAGTEEAAAEEQTAEEPAAEAAPEAGEAPAEEEA